MVKVELTGTIRCTPEEYLAFVLDVERYRQVDDKIGPITWVRSRGNVTEFKFRPRLPGMNMPEPKAVSQMRLIPGERIDIRLAPLPHNLVNRLVAKFEARFSAEPVPAPPQPETQTQSQTQTQTQPHTRVTRMISFRFNPLVRWLFEPRLKRALHASVARELRLSKEILERQP